MTRNTDNLRSKWLKTDVLFFSLFTELPIFTSGSVVSILVKRSFFLLFIICSGCFYFKKQPVAQIAWQNTFDPNVLARTDLLCKALVRDFYNTNNYRLTWLDSSGFRPAADSMLTIIRSAGEYGLIPGDYHLTELHKLHALPYTHAAAVQNDLYLTDAFFALRFHLKQGRVDRKTLKRISLVNKHDAESIAALHHVLANNSTRTELNSREPDTDEYRALKLVLHNLISAKSTDSLALFKIDQLTANLERRRWYPALPHRYIAVNVPSCMLKVVDSDSVVLESKVIVGKPETPTPELESIIRSFVIYPYWHVPGSIAKEILPHIREDTLYLEKHNYDILNNRGEVVEASSIDWALYEDGKNFPFTLRQREGYDNTMGVIKFVFSNPYGVYLHDTNSRKLFSREARALSHGCVRVHKAAALAHFLAKDDDTYVSPEDLDVYLLLRHRMEVNVVRPIPLLLQYFTCEEKDGAVVFYKDIYGKDARLVNALVNKADPPL